MCPYSESRSVRGDDNIVEQFREHSVISKIFDGHRELFGLRIKVRSLIRYNQLSRWKEQTYMKNTSSAFVALMAALWMTGASAAVSEPAYVVFSIMGPQAFGPQIINGIVQPETLWDSTERNAVEEMRKEFGQQHAGQQRYIGFSVALTPTLNLKPDELKAEVVYALNLAENNSVPVFFHLDDEHFWWANPELSHNAEMQEWSDFPRAGETHGLVVPRYWLNWGDPPAAYPAPPPCFACQAFRAASAKRLKESVAEPIIQRLNAWKKQGKDFLFAGVAAGNETKVPDFSRGYEGYSGKPGEEAGLDSTRYPPVKVRMSKEDMVPCGYHSLYAMGYDRLSIERLAQTQHQSVNIVTKELLNKVAHDYAELQAKTLNQAGLPKERIYTHFTSTDRTSKSFEHRLKEFEAGSSSRAGSDNLAPPVESSINQYSRPGFTVVKSGVDLNELVDQLRKSGAPDSGKAWAAVESYACAGQPGPPQTKQQYEEYLGGLLAHGAKVVNCYGWNVSGGPYAVKGSGVVPAVKTWLAGERLPSAWYHSTEISPQEAAIHARLAKLQQVARDLVGRGRDPHTIQSVIESMKREVEPLANAGKITEVEAAIDRAIARLQAQR